MVSLQGKIIHFFDMKRRGAGKLLLCFLFNCLGLISLNTFAQDLIQPVQGDILLSGNFGELRATHFHSGIDIRTGGVEGWPVRCVKDGRLLRVSVSPTGYGRALYIGHADGTTSVYGHLKQFVPRVEEQVRELQYRQESFKIDEDFSSRGIYFRQGDTIAYSGNSGSSGGPHLHFEIRTTRTEHPVNPLLYYTVRDTRPPVVRAVYLYAIDEHGVERFYRRCPLQKQGESIWSAGQLSVPGGLTGIGVYVTDYMNGSWNKLGVYRLTVEAGEDTLYSLKMDSCAFDDKCFINDIKDFDRYKKKETVYRCFGNYQDRFPGVRSRNKGYVRVMPDSLVKVTIRLEDINGNRSVVRLRLKGQAPSVPEYAPDELLSYDRPHVLELPGCRLELDSCSLFSSVRKSLRMEQDTVTGGNIYVLSETEIPLFKKGRLFLAGDFSRQSVLCEMNAATGNFRPAARRTSAGLEAAVGYLNRYTVVEDSQAPVISWLGKFPDRTLRFRIKDDLSGIAVYRGEVNGQWCLFAYDPRVNLLQCSLNEPVFRRGQLNEVRIFAEDYAGNRQELVIKVQL